MADAVSPLRLVHGPGYYVNVHTTIDRKQPVAKRRKLWIAASVVAALLAVAAGILLPRYAPKVIALWSTQQATASIVDDGTSVTLIPANPNGDLVVYLHGAGQTYSAVLNDPETSSLTRALLEAGYTVTAAEAGGNAWGNAASVSDYRDLIDGHEAENIYLIAESMGALAGAQIAADPDVRAWVALYPVCDVSSIQDGFLRAQIDMALGDAKQGPIAWPETPVKVWASPDDEVVPFERNAATCAPSGSLTSTSGDHGDASNFEPARVVEFFSGN